MFNNQDNPVQNFVPEVDIVLMPTVDRVEYGKDWAKGYKNGEVVITMGGVSDISAIQLLNEQGETVIPAPAPLSEVEQLQNAIKELSARVEKR